MERNNHNKVYHVLFDGSKSFHKVHVDINIILVEHVQHSCIEVIAFNETTGANDKVVLREMPRIYINYNILKPLLNRKIANEMLAQKIDKLLLHHKPANHPELMKKIIETLAVQSILSRIEIPHHMPTGKFVLIFNQADKHNLIDDITEDVNDLTCSKPNSLAPYPAEKVTKNHHP